MKNKDLYLKILVGIGIWFAIVTVLGVWEYNILKAEMVLNDKLLSHDKIVQQAPFAGGRVAYVTEMFVWTAIILVVGYIWSMLLFPRRNLLEKVVFSMVLGIFAMPISIFIPFVVITATTIFSTLMGTAVPDFVGSVLNSIVELFSGGYEQIYEFTNVLVFFIIGGLLLIIKSLFLKQRSEISTDSQP
jgi:hypothetical protein